MDFRHFIRFHEIIRDIGIGDFSSFFIRTTDEIFFYRLVNGDIQEKWHIHLHSQIEPSPILLRDQKAIIADDSKLYAIDITTGSILWDQPLEANNSIVLQVLQNLILVDIPSQSINAYNVESGQLLWKYPTGRGKVTAYIENESVFILDEGITSVDKSTGLTVWKKNDDIVVTSAFDNGVLYYLGQNDFNGNISVNYLVAFDTRNQNEIWRKKIDVHGLAEIKIIDNTLFIEDSDHLFQFDPTTSNILWNIPMPFLSDIEILGTDLYLLESQNKIIDCYDMETKTKIGALRIAKSVSLTPTDKREMISSANLLFYTTRDYLMVMQQSTK